MTFSNVVSCMALFVALGGTSYAALKITGKNVKNSSLTGADVKRSSLTGSDVRNNSLTSSDVKNLTASDFAPGQLVAGAPGPAGPAGPAGARGETGPAGAPGVIAASFVYQTGEGVVLPGTIPDASQVNFNSSTDPDVSGGLLKVTEPGQLHAEAATVLNRAPGAGGTVFCDLRVSGGTLSNTVRATFSDAGKTPQGDPATPVLTLPLVGSMNVEPGTYNVGVRCGADRPDLVRMTNTELHAVVYRR